MRVVLRALLILTAAATVSVLLPLLDILVRLFADMARFVLVLRPGMLIGFVRQRRSCFLQRLRMLLRVRVRLRLRLLIAIGRLRLALHSIAPLRIAHARCLCAAKIAGRVDAAGRPLMTRRPGAFSSSP
jgi:hypothetical protein